MKKYLTLVIFLLLAGSLLAQEKYPVPVLTGDQKHGNMVFQYWVMNAAGISFAKAHGVTPYEYGKYIGNLFAPTWGQGNNFEGYVKGAIYNMSFLCPSDAGLVVKENEDGSVSIRTDDSIWHKFFPEGQGFASYDEFIEYMRGINEPIADHMGATITIKRQDTQLVFTLKKK
jgi:hypothetical protein